VSRLRAVICASPALASAGGPPGSRAKPAGIARRTAAACGPASWLAGSFLLFFSTGSCHPADSALAVRRQVWEGSAGLPAQLPRGIAPGTGTVPMPGGQRRGHRHVGPAARTSFVWCLWEVPRPLWRERRVRTHGREKVFPPRAAGESQKGRAFRSRSRYKYTRYTGTRGPSLFLPAGSQDEKESIPPSPARRWQRDVPRARAAGLGTSHPTPAPLHTIPASRARTGAGLALPHRLHRHGAKSGCQRAAIPRPGL